MNNATKSAMGLALALLIGTGAQAQVSDQQIKDFFATNPTPEQIAAAAASLGMNGSQISAAMGVANYGGSQAERDAAINSWVANQNNGYTWAANGAVVQNGQTSLGRAAAAAAISQGTAAYGQSAAWARGSQSICPTGMSVSLNRVGIPKCIGEMTREFPTGEAQINTAAVKSAGSSGSQQLFSNTHVATGNVATSNIASQQYQGAPVGAYQDNPVGPGTIQAVFGKPTGVDYTGGSGIFLPNGAEIAKQDIANFFNSNPTNEQVGNYAYKLGLNQYQVQNALGQWRGIAYAGDIAAPYAAGTVGGSAGGAGTQGNSYQTPGTGAWGSGTLGGRGWGGNNWAPNDGLGGYGQSATGAGTGIGPVAASPFSTTGTSGPATGSTAAPGTIQAVFGKPTGVDYTGGSGIFLPNGTEISKQDIANFFNTNPTNEQVGNYAYKLGLNQYQVQNALAQWRGIAYSGDIAAPYAAGTVGGSAGGAGTQGNSYQTPGTGAWGSGALGGRGWGGNNWSPNDGLGGYGPSATGNGTGK